MQEIASNSTPARNAGNPATELQSHAHDRHSKGLLLVGIFKMSKALFFTALGAGALHLVHRDIGDLVMRLADALRIDPEGKLVSLLMDKADLIDPHHLKQAGILSFLYAGVCVVEGTGLLLEKTWAEYFTVILTAAALPWEIYELFAHFSSFRIALLLINLAVLGYLLWYLKHEREKKSALNQIPGAS
jgi:uncharacterized membrane protein (DUF2068 family)